MSLVYDSAKKAAKTNMSSILVIAKELQAVPTAFPNCMMRGEGDHRKRESVAVLSKIEGLQVNIEILIKSSLAAI